MARARPVAPVLSPHPDDPLARVSSLGPAPPRLPSRERRAARAERRARLAHPRQARGPRGVGGGGGVRAPSGARGIGRLGGGAEERPGGRLLSPGPPPLPPLRPRAALGGALRPGLRRLRARGAQQDRCVYRARSRPRLCLVEAGIARAPRHRARRSLLPRRPGGRARDGDGGEVPGRGAGRGLDALRGRPLRAGRPRAVLLRRQARGPDSALLHLPALDDRRGRLVAVALSAGRRRSRRRALEAPGSDRERAAGGGPLFRDHARARARLRRCLPVPLLLRRRSLPVSREPRPDHAARRARHRWGAEGRRARCGGPSRVRRAPPRPRRRHLEPRAEYARALAVAPGYAPAHNGLGLLLLDEGKATEAIAEFEQAIRLRPDLAAPFYNLGNALVALDRWREAEPYYERALQIDPE